MDFDVHEKRQFLNNVQDIKYEAGKVPDKISDVSREMMRLRQEVEGLTMALVYLNIAATGFFILAVIALMVLAVKL